MDSILYFAKAKFTRTEKAEFYLNWLLMVYAVVSSFSAARLLSDAMLYMISCIVLAVWHSLLLILCRLRLLLDVVPMEFGYMNWKFYLDTILLTPARWAGLMLVLLVLVPLDDDLEKFSPDAIIALTLIAFGMLGILVILQKFARLLYCVADVRPIMNPTFSSRVAQLLDSQFVHERAAHHNSNAQSTKEQPAQDTDQSIGGNSGTDHFLSVFRH